MVRSARPGERPEGADEVPTYILLSTLSPHGVGTLKANPQRLLEVNAEVEQMGARVVEQWAVLGPYDFVNIVEAPDEKVIARVSVELAARGTAHFQTLTAIPVDGSTLTALRAVRSMSNPLVVDRPA